MEKFRFLSRKNRHNANKLGTILRSRRIWIGRMAFSAVLGLGLLYLSTFSIGNLPALGALIDPINGIWSNGTSNFHPNFQLKGLGRQSTVIWNAQQIPYMFASSPEDLYRIQGFTIASQRLWQMEFMARASSGRLSELFGVPTLNFDKFNRAIALQQAAENMLIEANKDPFTKMALEAYAQGVNDYIKSLNSKSRPVEYKFFGINPEPWTPLKSALIYVGMSWQLSGYDARPELSRTNTLIRLGQKRFDQIFPKQRPWPHPMTETGQQMTAPRDQTTVIKNTKNQLIPINKGLWPPPNLGSNAWAVRFNSHKGFSSILASDPHLGLTFPSIWFINQLSDGLQTVLGASIPGVPGVMIGANSTYAWSITNAGFDAVDWYKIKFKDNSWKEYSVDGKWLPVTRREEKIYIKGQQKPVIVPVFFTHHGPVAFGYNNEGNQVGLAMRWTGRAQFNSFATFLDLNRGSNQTDFKMALEKLGAPALNFIYTDGQGNIAAYSAGAVPDRTKGTGKQINDGSNSAFEWKGFLAVTELPRNENPINGRVFSANQAPAGKKYPYYLGIFPPEYRAARIESLLQSSDVKNLKTHTGMQLDYKCLEAEIAVPKLLTLIIRDSLSQHELSYLNYLENWDFFASANSIIPTIFESWWRIYRTLAWRSEVGKDAALMEPPGTDIYAMWLVQNKFSSNPHQNKLTALRKLVTQAFQKSISEIMKTHGRDVSLWQWGKINAANLSHISHIPGFGGKIMGINGGLQSLNAFHGSYGPSLRLVIQFDKDGPNIMAAYPGAQSGNPGDYNSTQDIDDFAAGKLKHLSFAKSEKSIMGTNIIIQHFEVKP